eukprot:scaffold172978_cov62-Cyclotella_meneghiniana.AAC.4
MSDNEHTAKKARHNDHVVLNVGGTKFSTSIITLNSSSSYFKRLFSQEWAESRDNSEGDVDVFVDQDPEPFRVLLSYMRLGKVLHISDLTLPVLLQAKFFGIDKLLAAVCGVARRSEEDSPLLHAAREAELVPKVEKKKFAKLTLCCGDLMRSGPSFDGQEDLDVIDGREIVASVEFDNADGESQTKFCTTFIDGLNWLHCHGFTKYERRMDLDFDVDYYPAFELHFSKLIIDDNYDDDLASTVIDTTISTRKKQFVACLSLPHTRYEPGLMSCIEADIGRAEDKDRRQILGIQNVVSSVTRLNNVSNHTRWLQRNGFLRRENDIEVVYRNALRYSANFKDKSDPLVMMWSRDA